MAVAFTLFDEVGRVSAHWSAPPLGHQRSSRPSTLGRKERLSLGLLFAGRRVLRENNRHMFEVSTKTAACGEYVHHSPARRPCAGVMPGWNDFHFQMKRQAVPVSPGSMLRPQ